MERQQSIMVDNIEINPRLIQTAYNSSKQHNQTYEVLTEVFRLMNLSKISQANPADRNTKDMMKNIVNSQFIPRNFQQKPYLNKVDLNEAFPLNKVGALGSLDRKCKIYKGYLMEYEEGKEGKKKQIKNFINKVEAYTDKNKDNQIWIKEHMKYPYRIILVGMNDKHKGVYFQTPEKAEYVRVYLSQQFTYKGNFPKLMQQLNKQFLDSTIETFKSKLIFRKKMINKSNRFSRNLVLQDKNNQFAESQVRPVHNEPPNTSIFYNQPHRATNQPRESQMIKFSKLLQTKNREDTTSLRINQLRNLQGGYMQDFLQTWKEKAKNARFTNKKGSSMKSIYSNNNMASRFNENKSQFGPAGSHLPDSRKRADNNLDKSIFKALQGSSMKQSYVKQFNKEDDSQHLHCYSIQFLTLKDLFFKPIVTVEMLGKNRVQSSVIFNTIIVKKQPYLSYQLVSNQDEILRFQSSLKDYEINVKVIDFIANEEVLIDKITMRTKKITEKASLISDNKLLKLQVGLNIQEQDQSQVKQVKGTVELNIPPLSQDIKSKINSFWEKQSQSQGYYNQNNLSIYKILSQIESPPLSWWKGVKEDDYELYKALNNASKILGFRMIRSFTHILKSFSIIYPDLEQMMVKVLSFIMTLLKPYYFPQYFNKIQKLHRAIGLEEDCEFISKINLEMVTITKIVEFQCPNLTDKLNRKNIAYGYQMMQYIYQAFSRNFSPDCLIELWNFLYHEQDLLQLNMILVSIALIKYYEQDLVKAKRLKDFALILQSQQMVKTQHITKQMTALKQKYFSELKGDFLDQIKNIFNSKPLEPILFEFYRRQTIKIDKRKSSKEIQKKSILRKVNKQIQIDLPLYDNKKYCLHIFFRKLPAVGGSLTLRSNEIDYECLNHEKNRYFIIGQVSNRVTLIFLDLKSNEFSAQLQLNQGVNQFTVCLTSPRSPTVYRVSYTAGLLTETQLQIFKRGKKFDHFLSPFVKQSQFLQEMNRAVQEADFLKKYDNNSSKDDLIKKIKVLFCSGTRTFNEIDFYVEQIQTSDLTIEEKIKLVKVLSMQLSYQFTLSSNHIYQKHLFKIFLEKSGFQFDQNQFECYYSDSLENQFDSPKIIKCRYIPQSQPNKEIKLQNEALNYFINKSSKFLYSDIFVDQFVSLMKTAITSQLGGFLQGDLKLLYSSNGQIYVKTWLLKMKNKNKEIEYEQIKEDTVDDIEQGEINEPQILMTEVLPSFAKISTILDYVNSSRQVDLKAKYQDKERRKLAESINIIKDCQLKFSKVITMRYQHYPESINIPFFLYYYQLIKDFSIPNIKNIYLNNLKSDIKAISLLKGTLKFGQNAKVESYTYQPDMGIYGNLRQFSKDAKIWFFFSYGNQQHQLKYQQARVFTNYGYGVFRWQPCDVLGFVNRVKPKGNSKLSSKNQQPTKEYLIIYRNQQKYVKPYELQFKHGAQSRIKEIQQNGGSRMQRQDRGRMGEEQGNNMDGSYKYLSKFIK